MKLIEMTNARACRRQSAQAELAFFDMANRQHERKTAQIRRKKSAKALTEQLANTQFGLRIAIALAIAEAGLLVLLTVGA